MKQKTNKKPNFTLHPYFPTKSTKHQFKQKKNDQPTNIVVTSFYTVHTATTGKKQKKSVQKNTNLQKWLFGPVHTQRDE